MLLKRVLSLPVFLNLFSSVVFGFVVVIAD
nr:MAG TPA: PsbA, PsbB, PsbC, PsbD, PsbE-FCP supercomplex, PLANT PROTEIN [Caudoviricetes sp.]